MAVVEMSKLRLIGLSYQKEDILNALQKTGSVELFSTPVLENTNEVTENDGEENARAELERVKFAVDFIVETSERLKDTEFYPEELKKDDGNFFVTYKEFTGIAKKEKDLKQVVENIEKFNEVLSLNKAERTKLLNLKSQLEVYEGIEDKFSDYKDTKTAVVRLGVVKSEAVKQISAALQDMEFTDFSVLTNGSEQVVLIVSMKNESVSALAKAGEFGFTVCPFDFDMTASEKLYEIDEKLKALELSDAEVIKSVAKECKNLRNLKILCDYYKFGLEKILASEKFRVTQTSFVLEGYLPKESEEAVKSAIDAVTDSVFYEFSAPQKGDNPPTKLKNKKLVRQAEFITDMYSAPDYREMDPNRFVFFFFMLFMGVIMADIGYGVLMLVIGLLLARKQKVENGTKKLWNVVAIGGVSSMIFGVVFNSLFGFSVLPFTLLVSPVPANGMDNLKMILVLCLFLGVMHITAGYICKAINAFRQNDILGGIFDGLIWVVFFVGFVFGTFNLIMGTLMSAEYMENMNPAIKNLFNTMQTPGLYMALGALAVAALTAGRNEKGFGKITKGFSTVYGLINLMSDILSYARLFGLMLSGMIIANTFNDIAMSLMTGPLGYVFGAIVMIIGHAFNLAMGVLGAYIHDSRLQYIEFFGKFYTGEGEVFTPLGSKFDYIYLTK